MTFDFNIKYVSGKSIPHVDACTRLLFDGDDNESSKENLGHEIHWTGESTLPWSLIKDKTLRDRLLLGIMERIQNNNWSGCSPAERPFKSNRSCLSVEDSVICLGERLVVPASLQSRVLKLPHDVTHLGVAATRNKLKFSAWWPGFCQDVESFIGGCYTLSLS